MKHDVFGLAQVIVVIALVAIAAVLATPRGRVPLALRGLLRIMRKDRTGRDLTPGAATCGDAGRGGTPGTVPVWKRLLAFVLVILAFMLAMIVV